MSDSESKKDDDVIYKSISLVEDSNSTRNINENIILSKTDSILFMIGAGASVSAGIPTYRGTNGIYKNMTDVEVTMSDANLLINPGQIWKSIYLILEKLKDATESKTYTLLSDISELYPNSLFVTQNIDGLIKKVGINKDNIYEIHGNLSTMTCLKCYNNYKVSYDNSSYICTNCNNVCRPDVVLFGEDIDKFMFAEINRKIKRNKPKLIILLGTTLQFGYLEHIIRVAKKSARNTININPDGCLSTKSRLKMIHWEMTSDEGLEKLIHMITK